MSAITAAFSFIFNLDSWKSLGSASSSSCLETRSVKYSCLPATNHQHLHLDHHDQLLHHLQDRTRSSPSPDPQTSTRAQDSLLWQGPLPSPSRRQLNPYQTTQSPGTYLGPVEDKIVGSRHPGPPPHRRRRRAHPGREDSAGEKILRAILTWKTVILPPNMAVKWVGSLP